MARSWSHMLAVLCGHIDARRWTMAMQVWELPWRPTVLVSGRSYYTVDPVSGLITRHKDVWDALDNNQFPSPEAIILLAQQVRRRGQQFMLAHIALVAGRYCDNNSWVHRGCHRPTAPAHVQHGVCMHWWRTGKFALISRPDLDAHIFWF